MDNERRAAVASDELHLTREAFDNLRADLIATWASTTLEASAYREHLFHAVKGLDLVRAALMSVVDTGILDKKAAEVAPLFKVV